MRQALSGSIGRAIIDDDEFPVLVRLGQNRPQRQADRPGSVVRRHRNSDQRLRVQSTFPVEHSTRPACGAVGPGSPQAPGQLESQTARGARATDLSPNKSGA